ncbi:hypothetical protein ABT354_25225 [Streptomyces sp. NPDC000594]|uniref:hypothetical protein n=1 Tax=Streptomyces sp. NPDC000594 TaxID=3154261 RepID=UPI00331847E3
MSDTGLAIEGVTGFRHRVVTGPARGHGSDEGMPDRVGNVSRSRYEELVAESRELIAHPLKDSFGDGGLVPLRSHLCQH